MRVSPALSFASKQDSRTAGKCFDVAGVRVGLKQGQQMFQEPGLPSRPGENRVLLVHGLNLCDTDGPDWLPSRGGEQGLGQDHAVVRVHGGVRLALSCQPGALFFY